VKRGVEATQLKFKFLCEKSLPSSYRWNLIAEDVGITFLPNAPNGCHEDLHEERMRRYTSLMSHHLKKATLQAPLDAQHKPAIYTGSAFEEKMHSHLLNTFLAHDIVVPFL